MKYKIPKMQLGNVINYQGTKYKDGSTYFQGNTEIHTGKQAVVLPEVSITPQQSVSNIYNSVEAQMKRFHNPYLTDKPLSGADPIGQFIVEGAVLGKPTQYILDKGLQSTIGMTTGELFGKGLGMINNRINNYKINKAIKSFKSSTKLVDDSEEMFGPNWSFRRKHENDILKMIDAGFSNTNKYYNHPQVTNRIKEVNNNFSTHYPSKITDDSILDNNIYLKPGIVKRGNLLPITFDYTKPLSTTEHGFRAAASAYTDPLSGMHHLNIYTNELKTPRSYDYMKNAIGHEVSHFMDQRSSLVENFSRGLAPNKPNIQNVDTYLNSLSDNFGKRSRLGYTFKNIKTPIKSWKAYPYYTKPTEVKAYTSEILRQRAINNHQDIFSPISVKEALNTHHMKNVLSAYKRPQEFLDNFVQKGFKNGGKINKSKHEI